MTSAADTLLTSKAAQCMLPGLAAPPAPAVAVTEPRRDGIELELLLGNLCAALQRVKKTDPGSGDLVFIRGMRGRRMESLSADDITRLMVVRWKYRFQLPEGLRPVSPPG
jgi:hypothetical protein